MEKAFEVLIVGGSYAGLSAAMSLGRSLRRVLVVDGGKPCNATTPHSHNFLTQDGSTPAEIAGEARRQLSIYESVELVTDLVVKVEKVPEGFKSLLQSGTLVMSKKIIFATGIRDQLLDVPGFAECWGISVIHCPYCHGYEYRAKRMAILGNGEVAMHYAMLVGNLTSELQIFTNGKADFAEDQVMKLKKHGISINELPLVEIDHVDGYLRSVVLKKGNERERHVLDALYYRPPFEQHCKIPEELGVELTDQGYLKVDAMQKTNVEGVFACGDNSAAMRSVATAVAAGNMTGAVVNRELCVEGF